MNRLYTAARLCGGAMLTLFGFGSLDALLSAADRSSAGSWPIVINEIYYDPPRNDVPAEFIELANIGPEPVDLSGWKFTEGVQYTFPVDTVLEPDRLLLIAADPSVIEARFQATAFGPWQGRLSGDGERIRLADRTGAIVDSVNYRAEFPWPIAANGEGASLELIHPGLDNDLAGSWRSSTVPRPPPAPERTLLDFGQATWSLWKGLAPPSPDTRWTQPDFVEDEAWIRNVQTPVGYGDPNLATRLEDMHGSYTTVYLRNQFEVEFATLPDRMTLSVRADDGAIVWMNGKEVVRFHVPPGVTSHRSTANNHAAAIDRYTLDDPRQFLREGVNTIAVQALNRSLQSADFTIDVRLETPREVPAQDRYRPTPGERNSAFALNAPPQIRQVKTRARSPKSDEFVKVTAKVTDPNGVAAVTLRYQVNLPGQFIPALLPRDPETLQHFPQLPRAANPDFEERLYWTQLTMRDDGLEGDQVGGDDVYTATLPPHPNRTLIRYRIVARDSQGASVTVPYPDDPSLNFAYYVYDGLPDYVAETHSFQPDGAGTRYSAESLTGTSIGVYSLLVRERDINGLLDENLAKPDPPEGDVSRDATAQVQLLARKTYNYEGAIVFDGVVYDHIGFRLRGSNTRYLGAKRNFKFRFNRGHYLAARNARGELYKQKWKVLVTGRNYGNESEQNFGLVESVNSRLWQLFGVPARDTHFVHFRVVDGPEEAPAGLNGQYAGDFWGFMTAFEDYDGIFLDNHSLPKGNLYRLADFVFDGKQQQRYQARDAVSQAEDYQLARFDIIAPGRDDAWLRRHVNLDQWYRYHTVVEAVRHYDMHPEPFGRHRLKNLAWYFEPPFAENPFGRVRFLEFDNEASWGPTVNDGIDQVAWAIQSVPPDNPTLQLEYRNTIREFRDLIWTEEVISGLIDRLAAPVTALSRADRDRWSGNPLREGSQTYQPRTIENKVASMKEFAINSWGIPRLDELARVGDEGLLPDTPKVRYVGDQQFAQGSLQFRTSPFSDRNGALEAIQWRLGEVSDPGSPEFDPAAAWSYEYPAIWEVIQIGESRSAVVQLPAKAVTKGRRYRVRVRHRDDTGRWSHWSLPLEFTAK